MPDFTGYRYESTAARYEGIFTFVPTYVYSDMYSAGQMFDQSIDEGTMVEKGEQISVKVSKGRSAVPLPAYNNMTGEDYVATLSALNIKYSIMEVNSSSIKKGYVIKCSKEVGDIVSVSDGETVIVYVSGGM